MNENNKKQQHLIRSYHNKLKKDNLTFQFSLDLLLTLKHVQKKTDK